MDRESMSHEENYSFDVAGYLILRNVLTSKEVDACNQALEQGGETAGMLGWPEPLRQPFRDLLVHPVLVWYLNQLCGDGFRLEAPPQLLGEVSEPHLPLVGGDEPRDQARAYYHQNDRRLCQAVNAVWALADVQAGDGGLVLVPCSHKSNVETPADILTGDDDMGLTLQPQLAAGDLLLYAGTNLQGMRPWRGSGPQRLLSYGYASRAAILHAGSGPETHAEILPEWMEELEPEQRAVLHKPGYANTTPPPNIDSDGKTCTLADEYIHPSIYIRDPNSSIDEKEFYFWDLCGHLVLRNVLSPEDIELANEAIDRFSDKIVVGEELARGSKTLAGTGRPTMGGLHTLPDPYCQPFRRMMANPAVVQRLNWMGGSGFRGGGGNAFCAVKGTSGHTLHDANEPLLPSRSYVFKNGRSYCEAITVAFQLRDVGPNDGGFACVPGSHKAQYRIPPGVRSCDDDMGLVVHPVMKAGDAVFFMDGAQTHGTLAWTSDIDRRAILYKYSSRNFNRSGGATVQPETRWGDLVEGMSEAELAVMRGPDRDAHGANVPRLLVQNGKIEVSFEKSSGGLYSQETPKGPGGKAS